MYLLASVVLVSHSRVTNFTQRRDLTWEQC